jgi:hypothetical protein
MKVKTHYPIPFVNYQRAGTSRRQLVVTVRKVPTITPF